MIRIGTSGYFACMAFRSLVSPASKAVRDLDRLSGAFLSDVQWFAGLLILRSLSFEQRRDALAEVDIIRAHGQGHHGGREIGWHQPELLVHRVAVSAEALGLVGAGALYR